MCGRAFNQMPSPSSFLCPYPTPPLPSSPLPLSFSPSQLGLIITDSTEVLTLTPPLLKLPNKYVAQWLITGLRHPASACLSLSLSHLMHACLHVCVCVLMCVFHVLCMFGPLFVFCFYLSLLVCDHHMWRPRCLAFTPGILTLHTAGSHLAPVRGVYVCVFCTHGNSLAAYYNNFGFILFVECPYTIW